VGRSSFTVRQASAAHAGIILDLLAEAARWLRGKNTDQWQKPWPDSRRRDERLLRDLAAGNTWIVWDSGPPGEIAAGTITIDTEPPVDHDDKSVWPASRQAEPALYVHRVVIRRSHSGIELGARLFDWASVQAMRRIGAPLLRIDVWTDNEALHAYYLREGFKFCDLAELPDYPARALFERRRYPNGRYASFPLITEHPPASSGAPQPAGYQRG
jgi:Acetyltransferase (GNAT) family